MVVPHSEVWLNKDSPVALLSKGSLLDLVVALVVLAPIQGMCFYTYMCVCHSYYVCVCAYKYVRGVCLCVCTCVYACACVCMHACE